MSMIGHEVRNGMTMTHALQWGVTAWSTVWASLDGPSEASDGQTAGFGFVRVVEPGVIYRKPPIAGGWLSWSESPGGRQRRYQMPWPEDDAPEMLTVLDLFSRLQPRRATLVRGDEHLQELDASIVETVRLVDRLHRGGGTLGFVQPDSVVYCRLRDGSLRIVLPDVGFAWDDEQGLREPRWIAEPKLSVLFEQGARRHNAVCLAALKDTVQSQSERKPKAKDDVSTALTLAQQSDIRMLARLIALALVGVDEVIRWCGESRAFLALPGRDKAPDTQAPVWDQVVAPALLGKVTTCAELIQGLERAPPSDHYLYKPPLPPSLWKRASRRALPGLIVAGALVGLVVAGRPVVEKWLRPQPAHPLCGTVYPSDPRFRQLAELEIAREAAQLGGLATVTDYWKALRGAEELPPACLGKLREEAAGWVNEQSLAIPDRLRREPMPQREQVELLQHAFALATDVERAIPGKCQRVIGMLLRQLEARGVPPQHQSSAEKNSDDPSKGFNRTSSRDSFGGR